MNLSIALGPENHKINPQAEKQKKTVTLVFTKKENATLKQKIQILDWHHAHGMKQSCHPLGFNVPQPLPQAADYLCMAEG